MATVAAAQEGTVQLQFSCPICYVDEVPENDQLILPECGHRFCAHCILTWSTVRSTCPLCKGSFEAALVRRALDGTPLAPGTWRLEPLALLRRAPWLVENSFGAALASADEANGPGSVAGALTPPPWYSVESTAINFETAVEQDDAEEAREQAFWEQEAYEAELQATPFLIGNRRFGAGGYIRGERLYGRPTRRYHRSGRKSRAPLDA